MQQNLDYTNYISEQFLHNCNGNFTIWLLKYKENIILKENVGPVGNKRTVKIVVKNCDIWVYWDLFFSQCQTISIFLFDLFVGFLFITPRLMTIKLEEFMW